MELITCKNAYYVKLGRGGVWEKSSIKKNILRIGWSHQTLSDINRGNWKVIQKQLEKENKTKGAATSDFHDLQWLCESTHSDLWITFHASHLWWCRVTEPKIRKDSVSKYRKVDKWRSEDIFGNQLLITQLPGKISKIQGFRGTICRIRPVEALLRLLNHQHSSEYVAILHSKEELRQHIENGIKRLHWKDFETLVDLIFREAGWRRISVLGETMKYSDIELEDPITGEMYQVQIKSAASLRDFKEYAENFGGGKYTKLFFAVHSPDMKLLELDGSKYNDVEILFPGKIAEMVIDMGLVNWLMRKIQ